MELHPQDPVVALKLAAHGSRYWTYAKLGEELYLSASQVFASVNRCRSAQLINHSSGPPTDRIRKQRDSPLSSAQVNRKNLKEFLVHGVKYAFPAQHGAMVRGMPTSYAAPPLNREIVSSSDPPPVWPFGEGGIRGSELTPLYKTVPNAAARDVKLYELLALLDAIRDGRARERELAIQELGRRLDSR